METQNKPSSKQEALIKAYGKAFNLIDKDVILRIFESEGWTREVNESWLKNTIGIDLEFNGIYCRPKSLQGIENNNGWISIESEKDLKELPKTYQSYHGAFNEFIYDTTFNYQTLLKKYAEKELTHYQPIIKPNRPIY